MSSTIKKGSIGTVALSVLFLGFLYLPVPGSEPSRMGPDTADVETRGQHYFAQISEGRNLDRPFPVMPVRDDNPSSPEKVELGRLLYFDPVLSGENTIACATCHHPDLGFSDNRGRSMGRGGVGLGPDRKDGDVLRRNTPTIWNAAYNHRQFWDGRATDLEEQAGGPIQDPHEMAQDPDELIRELTAIPEYVERFQGVFGGAPEEAVTFTHVTYAIAAFERTLLSRDSRYDRYARGDMEALTLPERRGLNLFRSLKTRCFECHNLPTFANPDFKVIGVPLKAGDPEDLGRAEVAGQGYEHAFKVPTLRNVALTAPYMHNGMFRTLDEVLTFYAGGGGAGMGMPLPDLDDKIRPFTLSPRERNDLIAFLHALTDESARPALPERVPSGLAVVPPLENQSPEMEAFEEQAPPEAPAEVRRVGQRLIVEAGERIQDAVDQAQPGDTVLVLPGVYHETLALDLSDVTLLGVERDGARPVLDGQGELTDGMVGSGSNLEIRGFDVRNYTANGLMIDLGTNLTFRDLYLENTGLYGIYPVEVVGVLIERSTVTGARDAGIYVGQAKDIVVRDNVVYGNVTGIEIENSIDAVVENNEVYDNAGGVLVFLLPNNPSKLSARCVVRGNRIYRNNHPNFADPTAIVARVPSGTGIMILAGDEVEVTGNSIEDNKSVGVAVLGLDSVFDASTGYDVDPVPEGIWVHGNDIGRNGLDPDASVREAGFDGADLIWDLSGRDNSWDESGASRLPYTLPGKDWSGFRRRLNHRLWQTAAALL